MIFRHVNELVCVHNHVWFVTHLGKFLFSCPSNKILHWTSLWKICLVTNYESEWTPGDGVGQGGLACCDSWGRKESDTTERLNWAELNIPLLYPFIYGRTLRLLPYLDYCKLLQETQRVSFLESRHSLIILQVERLWNLPHLFFMDVWSNKVGFRILHSVFDFLETCQINS